MYSDNKLSGDHTSVAEELLAEIPELEQKCRAVDKAVREGYFTISEALSAYKVSEIEYIPFLLLKNNKKLEQVSKQDQVFETIFAILSIFDSSITTFDLAARKAMINLKELTQNKSSGKKVFET